LRETNKFWKQELDRAFENEDDPELKPCIQMSIDSVAEVDQLLEIAEEHVNPFWVREVEFTIWFRDEDQNEEDFQNNQQEYWPKILQLLARCGHHLHRLCVDFTDCNGELFEFEDTLVRILHAVPNVRNLRIEGGVYVGHERSNDLQRYFRANTHRLPALPQLIHLDLTSNGIKWTGPLLSKLVTDPKQLKFLSLKSKEGDELSSELAFAVGAFTSLKHLDIEGTLEEVSQYLGSVASAPRPPLEKIKLSMALPGNLQGGQINAPEVRSVLQELNKFRDSLTTLELEVWGPTRPNGYDPGFPLAGVRLPKLKTLHLLADPVVLPLILMIDAPLTTLIVTNLPDPFDWPAFYTKLGHFGSTRQELNVDVIDGRLRMNENDYYALSINLPNLRTIKLNDITFATLKPLFHLSPLKKLEYFYVKLGHPTLEDSTRAFEHVDRKLNQNPGVWQVIPSLQKFCVEGYIRDDDDDNPRAIKRKTVTCTKDKGSEVHFGSTVYSR